MAIRAVFPKTILAAAALLGTACATDKDDVVESYRIVEEHATIPSTRALTGFRGVGEQLVLIEAGGDNFYLAQVHPTCGADLVRETRIGVNSRQNGAINEFSELIIDGWRCAIVNLSRVELIGAQPLYPPESESDGVQ